MRHVTHRHRNASRRAYGYRVWILLDITESRHSYQLCCYDVVWCGVVLCGVVWCDELYCGVLWCGVVLCGVM